MPISDKPYISFVVVGRNDNYGGDFLHRIQVFLNVLLILCEKHCLNMELVIVEWNPPEEKPRLADALTWVGPLQYCKVRIVEVPKEIHCQLPNSDCMPLFEFIGKNVGVRRARGDYILTTNADILFTEELIQFLASKELSPECFYRTTRYDVGGMVPVGVTVEEQLAYCKQHVTRINAYLGSFDNRFSQRFDLHRLLLNGWLDYIIWRIRHFPYAKPFTNASGDFTLMHRSHWHSLHGYPEVKGVDTDGLHHADSFMLYKALYYGLKQIRLRSQMRIYHQKHGFFSRPFSPWVRATRQQLLKERKPVIFNDETWGLGRHELTETVIA